MCTLHHVCSIIAGSEALPVSRVPVSAKYVPISPGSFDRKCEAPTSGKSPIPHSGIANSVLIAVGLS